VCVWVCVGHSLGSTTAAAGVFTAHWEVSHSGGTDQRHIEVGCSIRVDSSMLGQLPLLSTMRGISQQVWLAVGHQLVSLALEISGLVQDPVACVIEAGHRITDLPLAHCEVDGESASFVCSVDTGGWLRVWDLGDRREVLTVEVGDGCALHALLCMGDGELWVSGGGGGGASAELHRYRMEEWIRERGWRNNIPSASSSTFSSANLLSTRRLSDSTSSSNSVISVEFAHCIHLRTRPLTRLGMQHSGGRAPPPPECS
jgi:hypothetical protein